MEIQFNSNMKYVGVLLWSCTKDDGLEQEPNPDSTEKSELVLTPSATEIDKGDTVTFEVTADGQVVDADVYINNDKINGANHIFEEAGTHQVIAKKEGYADSEAIDITSYQLDVYVSGNQSTDTALVAKYWKNGVPVDIDNGNYGAEADVITLDGDDLYD